MDEYIDKQAFNDELAKLIPWAIESPMDNAYTEGLNAAHNALLDFPAADVAPVIHAAWVPADNNKNLKACSNCHGGKKRVAWNPLTIKHEGWAHCPHCGAQMDA